MPERKYEPIVLSVSWTAGLYRLVIVSEAPGRRRALIVGPRGATDEQAKEAALALVAHINR
jgi:hypothetical protein